MDNVLFQSLSLIDIYIQGTAASFHSKCGSAKVKVMYLISFLPPAAGHYSRRTIDIHDELIQSASCSRAFSSLPALAKSEPVI
jgi:hypothetical protein